MKYEPFVNANLGIVGFKCTRSDGEVCHIYLNPSDPINESDSDIFVYIGQLEPDPSVDSPEVYIIPVFEQDQVRQLLNEVN